MAGFVHIWPKIGLKQPSIFLECIISCLLFVYCTSVSFHIAYGNVFGLNTKAVLSFFQNLKGEM